MIVNVTNFRIVRGRDYLFRVQRRWLGFLWLNFGSEKFSYLDTAARQIKHTIRGQIYSVSFRSEPEPRPREEKLPFPPPPPLPQIEEPEPELFGGGIFGEPVAISKRF